MSIVVVEDYESEDEGLAQLFGDTTVIPPDRRKQITRDNVTIEELKILIAEKEKEQQKIVEDTDEEEDDFDTRQITYQGVNYILGADDVVITDGMEIVGEWDGKKIYNWEPGMLERHNKMRVSK
tara:strand:+ start:1578 stop:1949 length:372 start_codon:yes stop_codon:yes gene_type:complete